MMRKTRKRYLLGQPLPPEEIETLRQLSKFHPYPDFRRRALGRRILNSERSVVDIVEILRVSDQPVCNGAKGWRKKGLVGIRDGRKGGVPVKPTVEMLDRFSLGLKARGLSFKRNRLSLKKRDETLFRDAQDAMGI